MAINHLFAFSEDIDGVMIAAGSPYGCGSCEGCATNSTLANDMCAYNFTAFADVQKHIDHNVKAGRWGVEEWVALHTEPVAPGAVIARTQRPELIHRWRRTLHCTRMATDPTQA